MLSKQLESALAAEVAEQKSAFVINLRNSVLAAVNRCFDELSGTRATPLPSTLKIQRNAAGRTIMTTAIREEILRLSKKDIPQSTIAKKLGMAPVTVRRALDDHGSGASKKNRSSVTPELRTEVIKRLEKGESYSRIAKAEKCSESTVQRIKTRWVQEALEAKEKAEAQAAAAQT